MHDASDGIVAFWQQIAAHEPPPPFSARYWLDTPVRVGAGTLSQLHVDFRFLDFENDTMTNRQAEPHASLDEARGQRASISSLRHCIPVWIPRRWN
jgi:hypothetical protein